MRLHQYEGSTENNITYLGEGNVCGPTVVRDDADPDADRRYKMVYDDTSGVGLSFSPDGLNWTPSPANPIPGETQRHPPGPVEEPRSKEVVHLRAPETHAGHWKRRVSVSESSDLENWTEFTSALLPDELDAPSFTIWRCSLTRTSTWDSWRPYRNATSSSMEVQLASSRDGYHWQRPVLRDTFIPLGNIGQFDSHIIWVACAPVPMGDELWFYYSGFKGRHDWAPHQASIGLATLRLDGFVCLDATDPLTVGGAVSAAIVDSSNRGGHTRKEVVWPDEGNMITRPFTWEGDRLVINAWAPEGEGSVRCRSSKPMHPSRLNGASRCTTRHSPASLSSIVTPFRATTCATPSLGMGQSDLSNCGAKRCGSTSFSVAPASLPSKPLPAAIPDRLKSPPVIAPSKWVIAANSACARFSNAQSSGFGEAKRWIGDCRNERLV